MHKPWYRRALNRLLQALARGCPGSFSLRPALHRLRGVRIGTGVFIGDDVYLDNEYPECIELGDGVQLSIRVVIVAHTRGPGQVILEPDVFVGPHCLLVCGAGRTLRIGTGAVLGPGCVITRNVSPRAYLTLPALRPAGIATIPLPRATTMEEFLAGLRPWPDGHSFSSPAKAQANPAAP